MLKTKELIFECLDNAYFENGYTDQITQTPYAVALELKMYADYYFADYDIEKLKGYVQDWQDEVISGRRTGEGTLVRNASTAGNADH